MEKTIISVICTVKNGESTLSSTIDSVLNQTFKKFELIIIDDGSTDNTKSILKKYSKLDSRIKYYLTDGIGRSNALNKAIDLSKGKYIANIDADDLFHPEKLELQIEAFKKESDAFLIGTNYLIVHNDEEVNWEKEKLHNLPMKKVTQHLFIRNSLSHSSIMMIKDDVIRLGMYESIRKSQVDYELWLRALTNNQKMYNLEHVLTGKRIHESQSFENKRRFVYTYRSMKLQLEYLIKYRKYWYYLPIPLFTFVFAQLPFKVRNTIKNIIRISN